jgi:hypothetical protein
MALGIRIAAVAAVGQIGNFSQRRSDYGGSAFDLIDRSRWREESRHQLVSQACEQRARQLDRRSTLSSMRPWWIRSGLVAVWLRCE